MNENKIRGYAHKYADYFRFLVEVLSFKDI